MNLAKSHTPALYMFSFFETPPFQTIPLLLAWPINCSLTLFSKVRYCNNVVICRIAAGVCRLANFDMLYFIINGLHAATF